MLETVVMFGGCFMKNIELYKLLKIPSEVEKLLLDYEYSRNIQVSDEIINKILNRSRWDEGIKELQKLLCDDPDGIKILWELLNIAKDYSYREYNKRKISTVIFADTMKFCTRFLNEYYQQFHTWKFIWAWWFPRQISLNEYRIEALEYEFIDMDSPEIAIHIPSDADLRNEPISCSIKNFNKFRKKYYSDWQDVNLTCETWMLMPELKELLGSSSNIILFQDLFEIDYIDYDATWYMDWIFPGVNKIDEKLPERTTLQRNMKKYLLDGRKFGIAKGHLK